MMWYLWIALYLWVVYATTRTCLIEDLRENRGKLPHNTTSWMLSYMVFMPFWFVVVLFIRPGGLFNNLLFGLPRRIFGPVEVDRNILIGKFFRLP